MKEKALKAYEAIFSDQETLLIDGTEHHMERTPRANLRFFNIEGYSFLEQNPRKSSHWGSEMECSTISGRRNNRSPRRIDDFIP
jgi:hypothetical protein